jgi:hypothetical protein
MPEELAQGADVYHVVAIRRDSTLSMRTTSADISITA